MLLRKTIILSACLWLAAGAARADLVFTVEDAVYDDGATLTGTFTTDDNVTTLVAADLTTSADVAGGFASVAYAFPGATSLSSPPFSVVLETGGDVLVVVFDLGLNPLGTTPIGNNYEVQGNSVTRTLVSGEVVVGAASVPEPASLALLAFGLPAAVAWRRRRAA